MKTRSVGVDAGRPNPPTAKALIGLMLCASVLAFAGCGQKRPLQLPSSAKNAGTGSASTPAPKADPASAPASAAMMPQR